MRTQSVIGLQAPAPDQIYSGHPAPVLATTRLDRVLSGMMAVAGFLLLVTSLLAGLWLSNREVVQNLPAPIEIVDLGGFEDGKVDETPHLETPLEAISDPSIVETEQDQPSVSESLEVLIELSDAATERVESVIRSDSSADSGRTGSRTGTGNRPLGPRIGVGQFPRDQRWIIRFDDSSLGEYARQLDYFNIELGALFPDRLVYISKLSQANPKRRVVTTGRGEDRLYMRWRGGQRKQADLLLFRKAGDDASGASLIHFYPADVEELLARVEREYRNRKPSEIRRTVFEVRRDGGGYQFVVVSQIATRSSNR